VRLYGRVGKTWFQVQTDAQGNNDLVYVTAVLQCVKLNKGESPFYSWAGIPAEDAVIQQVFPDYDVSVIQQVYAPNFASLIISRRPGGITPVYDVNVITHQGVKLNPSVKIAA
jgi:hypothetical protein